MSSRNTAKKTAKKSPKKSSKPKALKSKKSKKAKEKGPGGPRITKGSGDGSQGTPAIFMQAIEKKFGQITRDLAASAKNTKGALGFYSKEEDAFKQAWHEKAGFLWLNPPFAWIGPWVIKCLAESKLGANILMLVPASVGAKWFEDNVFKKADVHFLYGRIAFDGSTTVYPKDCMVIHFRPDTETVKPDFFVWHWKAELEEETSEEVAAEPEAMS